MTSNQRNEPELKLPNAEFHFGKGSSDLMSGLTFRVRDVAAVRDAAAARGYAVADNAFVLGGVTFRLVACSAPSSSPRSSV